MSANPTEVKPRKKTKAKSKEPTPDKVFSKPVGKFTGIKAPFPPFPAGLEDLQKFALEVAKGVNRENGDLDEHIKEKFWNNEDIMIHLYNTNILIDRLLYLVVWALHTGSHEEEHLKELENIKKAVMELDTNFHKHEPKLQYIDKQIQNHLDREKRADELYG